MDATGSKFGRGPKQRSLSETACEQAVEENFKKAQIKANLGHRKSASEGSYLLKDGSKGSAMSSSCRSSRNDVVLQLHSNLKRKQLRGGQIHFQLGNDESREGDTVGSSLTGGSGESALVTRDLCKRQSEDGSTDPNVSGARTHEDDRVVNSVSEDASIDVGPPTWRPQEEPSSEATRFQLGVRNSQSCKARQWQCSGNSTFEPIGLLLTSDCGHLANSGLEEVVPDEDPERIQQGPPVPTRDAEESPIATLVIHEVYMKSGPVVQESCPDPPRPWARGIERVSNLLDMIDDDDVVNSVVSETTAVLSELQGRSSSKHMKPTVQEVTSVHLANAMNRTLVFCCSHTRSSREGSGHSACEMDEGSDFLARSSFTYNATCAVRNLGVDLLRVRVLLCAASHYHVDSMIFALESEYSFFHSIMSSSK